VSRSQLAWALTGSLSTTSGKVTKSRSINRGGDALSNFFEPKTQKALYGNIVVWVFATLALIAVIAILLWAFGVFTAPLRGQAGAFKQKESAINRVQQQAKFEQIAADYDGYLVQIQNAQVALKSASAETRAQRETELIGLRQICVTAAQDFNAESRKYLARDWKSAGLPERLDPIACQGS